MPYHQRSLEANEDIDRHQLQISEGLVKTIEVVTKAALTIICAPLILSMFIAIRHQIFLEF